MIGLEHKIFSWRLVIILRRSQTLWVNSSLYLQIWNITITPRPCWNVTIPGPGSHTLHSEWSHPRHEWSRLIMCEISVHLTSPGCCHATIHCPVFPHMCPRLYWLCWPAPVLLLNAHPVSGHSPALLTSHTGDFNDSHCSVLCRELGSDWLTLTPCSALIGATRPTLLTIAGRPVLTCERPHWLGARGSSHLQNLARAFLRCWGL